MLPQRARRPAFGDDDQYSARAVPVTDPDKVDQVVESFRTKYGARDVPLIVDSVGNYVRAVLYNGLGRYDDALAAARQATECAEDVAFSTWGLVELIEAKRPFLEASFATNV